MPTKDAQHYDFIVVGSGFGGSVSALRLAEKGYSVLVLEKGRRFHADDFPKTNWELSRWMWLPWLNWRGIFKMTFFKHVTILSGVGVGGGSLVYANTLPVPKRHFFESGSWASLGSWQSALEPFYKTAKRMLGATPNPRMTIGDRIFKEIAEETGREGHFHTADVGVYFGEPGKTLPDPYFGGEGPDRTGCLFCGACMTGCRHGAKNTLDKNYLYFAEKLGVQIQPDTLVEAVYPREDGGYELKASKRLGWMRRSSVRFSADQVVFAGGVLGTVELLLRMKEDPKGLPDLSPRLGDFVRTNSESLIGVVSERDDLDFTDGVAITSILHTDEHSHVEPVRYGKGSGFFRLLGLPHSPAPTVMLRLLNIALAFLKRPVRWFRAFFTPDWATRAQVLLFMRSLDGNLSFRRAKRGKLLGRGELNTEAEPGNQPAAFIPEATEFAERFAEKVDGVPMNIVTETLLGTPSTAHILGGCCMGRTVDDGVIDADHRIHNYDGLYVVDGSSVSANPGVNPSLTITALAERAMSKIPHKDSEFIDEESLNDVRVLAGK